MSERPNRSTNRPGPAARDAETFRSVPASARARKMYPDLIRHREEISLARIFSEAGNSPEPALNISDRANGRLSHPGFDTFESSRNCERTRIPVDPLREVLID